MMMIEIVVVRVGQDWMATQIHGTTWRTWMWKDVLKENAVNSSYKVAGDFLERRAVSGDHAKLWTVVAQWISHYLAKL